MEKSIKFEKALAELELITEKLEDEQTPLDEALKLYEKGISLIAVCTEKLNNAEQKVILLQKSGDKIIQKDFETE